LESACARCGEPKKDKIGDFKKVGDFFYCRKNCLDQGGQPKALYYRRKAPEEKNDNIPFWQ
jgi:hypothetical protein